MFFFIINISNQSLKLESKIAGAYLELEPEPYLIKQERSWSWSLKNFSAPGPCFSMTEVIFITEQLKFACDITTVLESFSWDISSYVGSFHVVMAFAFHFIVLKRYSFFKIILETFVAFTRVDLSRKISERILVSTWVIFLMIMS